MTILREALAQVRAHEVQKAADLCARTLCLWKPGVPQSGMRCSFAWSGRMPCTGRLVCHACGKEAQQ